MACNVLCFRLKSWLTRQINRLGAYFKRPVRLKSWLTRHINRLGAYFKRPDFLPRVDLLVYFQ